MRPLIKICGIRSAPIAQAAVRAGADMIGIICHPSSKRYVDCATAKNIATATREVGGVPVAVFVDHTVSQMTALCDIAGITTVQLHGDSARKTHTALSPQYQKIFVCPVGASGCYPHDLAQLQACDRQRDFVLFDHPIAGSGQVFPWENLDDTGCLRMGIAGGLHQDNVSIAIERFQPAFVDVSSGVENLAGEKDIELIREFIEVVKNSERI